MNRSLLHAFFETASRKGPVAALRYKANGRWHDISWDTYARLVRRAARGLMRLGVEPGTAVAIVGGNCPEWLVGHLAIMAAGGVSAALYPTSTAAQSAYTVEHCEAGLLIADCAAQIDKLRSARLGSVQRYVQMHGEPAADDVMSFAELLSLGDRVPEEQLDRRLDKLEPTTLATLIYTSGTTGAPKAVMLCHENLLVAADAAARAVGTAPNDHVLSFLPLSHIAEQVMSVYVPVCVGVTVSCAQSLDMLGESLREVRPTVFTAVPRVWEKMQARMMAASGNSSPAGRRVVAWARRQGLHAAERMEQGRRPHAAYWLAKKLVFDRVRKKLGLDRARYCGTGAAPIARSTLDFFFSLGVPVFEIYGMSECCGPATLSHARRFRIGKAGPPLPGTEIRIADDGEVCLRGGHVFMGYMKDPAATREALSQEGWLRTGDLGELDTDQFLSITGRKKDIVITAGGKNIAPACIEARLKQIPGVGQACVIGDERRYLTALLTVDADSAERVSRQCGAATADPGSLTKDQAFVAHVQSHIDAINATMARYETIKAFTVLSNELCIERDELTPTLKMKRHVIMQRYRNEIDAMYPRAQGVA
jgi:long-subunit acyl-CoA synthetase (AMP-forming)